MYTFRLPTGAILDGVIELTWNLENTVFAGGDDVLPGSYTFPAELPATSRNLQLLGFPQRPDAAAPVQRIEDVTVLAEGVPVFVGTLQTQRGSASAISVSVLIAPVASVKKLALSELDLGGERSVGTLATLMKNTCLNPESFDFIFFPVLAPGYRGEAVTWPTMPDRYQNHWDHATETFSTTSAGLTPFPKLLYLLERVFASTGFSFSNDWLTTKELKRLCLYDNTDLRAPDGSGSIVIPATFNLRRHVGKWKALDFLRALVREFSLGIFTNTFEKKVSLVPLRDILSATTTKNWTSYALADAVVTYAESEAPQRFFYPKPDFPTDLTVAEVEALPAFENRRALNDYFLAMSGTDGQRYYVRAQEEVVECWEHDDGGGNTVQDGNGKGYARQEKRFAETPEFSPAFTPLMMADDTSTPGFFTPRTSEQGTYYDPNDNGKLVNNDPAPALMLFRGIQDDFIGQPIPLACNDAIGLLPPAQADIVTNGSVDAQAEVSLLWKPPYGIYEKWWAAWHQAIRAGKQVEQSFALPLAEITAFSFREKVRVGDMDFFLKSLQIGKRLGKGVYLAQAKMVSVV